MSDIIKKVVTIYDMKDDRTISHYIEYVLSTTNTGEILTFAEQPKYTPTKGDKIYFYPGCDIPRFKVKQFCQTHDVAVVKYKEKSSVRFIGPETLRELIHERYTNVIDTQLFLAWLDTVMCNAYEKLKQDIIDTKSDLVYINSSAMQEFCDVDVFGEKILYSSPVDAHMMRILRISNETSYQQVIDMLSDTNLKHQDDLLSLLNTGTVLDEEMYNQIHKMFESTDKENTRLAMEAMANCDFQKSAVYLLLLIQKYGSKIHNSGIRHHVNFKSLIKYFQITNLTSIDVDDMIDSLRHQKLLSVDNLNRLMPMAMQSLKESGEMKNIKIKDLELSPEAAASVAENILDSQTPEQEPSVKSEQTVV